MTFLMSLGGLSLGCQPGGGETDDSTGAGPGTGPNTTTTSSTTDDTPTTSGTSTTTTTDSTTTATPTTDDTTTTAGPVTETSDSRGFITTQTETTDSTTGEPAPELQVCADHGDKFAMCYPRYARYAAYYAMYCNELIAFGNMTDGPECAEAFEEYFACLNAVDCANFGMELEMPMTCLPQAEAVTAACPSLVGP